MKAETIISNLSATVRSGFFNRDEPIVFFIGLKTYMGLRDTLVDMEDYNRGANYGAFKNNKDKCLHEGFITVYIDGYTVHFHTQDKLIELLND
jgi:hypothetical protein